MTSLVEFKHRWLGRNVLAHISKSSTVIIEAPVFILIAGVYWKPTSYK